MRVDEPSEDFQNAAIGLILGVRSIAEQVRRAFPSGGGRNAAMVPSDFEHMLLGVLSIDERLREMTAIEPVVVSPKGRVEEIDDLLR